MENIAKRLKAVRVKLGFNQAKMAKEAGVLQKDISLIEADKKKFIPTEYLLFLSEKGIDLNWIYTGEGEIFLQDSLKKYKFEQAGSAVSAEAGIIPFYGKKPIEIITVDKAGLSQIAMVPMKVSAGYTAYCHDREFIEELTVFSLPDFQFGNFRAFEIMGNSMELTIMSQDWVVGERILAASQLKDGAIYVIVTSGNIICKRIINRVSRQGLIILKSDNPDYEEQTIEPGEILEMWMVRARLTKDFRSTLSACRFYDDEIRRLETITNGLIAMSTSKGVEAGSSR